MSQHILSSPIIVGGVGGSGTRLIVDILKNMNIFMGNVLNESNDNMQLAPSFPTFRRLIQEQKLTTHEDKKQIIFEILNSFEQSMRRDFAQQSYQGWGWKVPGNFLILEYLAEYFESLQYIHIIRHGLDMAYSTNQNQLHNWGHVFGIDIQTLPMPKAALKYWIQANNHAITLGKKLLKDRFLLLNFDTLCQHPNREIQLLAHFLELGSVDITQLSQLVEKPTSLGRYKQQDLSIFDQSELEAVKKLGFNVD